MKRTWRYGIALVAVGVMAFPCGLAGALDAAITVDGDPTDWLGNNDEYTSAAVQWTAIQLSDDPGDLAYTMNSSFIEGLVGGWIADDGGVEGPTPGGGDQDFDIEALYGTYNSNGSLGGVGVYVGIFTGFDPEGEGNNNGSGPQVGEWGGTTYSAGDLFFSFGPQTFITENGRTSTSDWDFAVDLDSGDIYATTGTGDWWISPDQGFETSRPFEIRMNNARNLSDEFDAFTGGGGDRGALAAYSDNDQTNANSDHNFIEAYVSTEFLLWAIAEGFGWDFDVNSSPSQLAVHWTMSCGNDVGDHSFGVPEPMSMVMLGCLGVGMFGVRRVRRKKS